VAQKDRPSFGTIDDDGKLRRGRPALPAEQRLAAHTSLRFTQAGLERVVRAAGESGVSASEFARQAALERAGEVLDGLRDA